MSRLGDLYDQYGQSPWLDNLKRGWINSGELQSWIGRGVRGITSNPTIFQQAITSSSDYDDQLADLIHAGASSEQAYWEMVISDIEGAAELLVPLHEESGGYDGFVSVEVAPALARDPQGTLKAATALAQKIAAKNVLIKIPGTAEGLPAIREATAAGISVNVTLLFSIHRYRDVIDAYIEGLEAAEGDLSSISSVASFFISRVDTAVDAQLDALGTAEALNLRGTAAVDQARVAYEMAQTIFTSQRWLQLAARGARIQRPLWASTSTKDPAYPPTKYVDQLIGPQSVNTIPDATITAFEQSGSLQRTIDVEVDDSKRRLARLGELGIDLDAVSTELETAGVQSFVASFDDLLSTLERRTDSISQRS